MKNLFFLSVILFGFMQMSAQDDENHREQIKALKTAYITEGLDLSPEEAQEFWPIYNDYSEERKKLYHREHGDIEQMECITEEGAKVMLKEFVEIEREEYLLKKKFYEDMQQFFPAKKVIQLIKVEADFNRKMIKEYRKRNSKT